MQNDFLNKTLDNFFFLYWILHLSGNVIDHHDDTTFHLALIEYFALENGRKNGFEFHVIFLKTFICVHFFFSLFFQHYTRPI